MTLSENGLIAVAVVVGGSFAGCCAFLWWRMRSALTDRELKLADQIGRLDDAIRALETRLTEHQLHTARLEKLRGVPSSGSEARAEDATTSEIHSEEASEIEPEIRAVIAAAASAALGPNATVKSTKAVPSPWTQQGRVLVQGGHNLRVPR